MPGILGYCGVKEPERAEQLLPAMIRAMDDENCQVDSHAAAGVGLARIHLDIIDHAPQPLWSEDGNIALIMTGEIFSWEGVTAAPASGAAEGFSNAELLLAAYLQFGAAFAERVNGSFAAAIWHVREQVLLLICDHLGACPLYYASSGSQLVFGSGARAVAQAPGLSRRANVAAVAELIAFEQVFGDKTLFEGVKLLPPGSILRFAGGALHISTYADCQYPEFYEHRAEAEYVEQWAYYMRQAVARQARPPYPLGMLMTGGLDSRSLIGMMDADAGARVALTFGLPGSDDLRIAREVAAALGVPHKYVPLDPGYLAQLGAKGVRITDGMKSCIHFNVLGPLQDLVQEAKVLYKGFLGGTLQGHVVTPDRLAPLRDEDAVQAIYARRNHLFGEQEWPQLYTDSMLHQVRCLPRQALEEALARSRASWWVDKESYVDLHEEDRRFTLLGVELARSRALVRIPMADKDYVRFSLSVPPGYRVNKHYYKAAIAKAWPKLAKIPVLPDGYPLVPCWRDLRLRGSELARWWLRNRGLSWIGVRSMQPYADYNQWLRQQLRPWLEQTLLSTRSLERGYFNPTYLRALVAAHIAGQNHAKRLGVLLSLELWHQQFLD